MGRVVYVERGSAFQVLVQMRNRIRVAHIITNFAAGGAQEYLLSIVEGLDRTLFEPMVFGRMEGELVDVFKSLNGINVSDVKSLRRNISPLHDMNSVAEIERLCRVNSIDIVHTHSSKAGVVGRLGASRAGVKTIVHTVHGFSFNDFMPALERRVLIGLESWMSRYTTKLLFVSNKDKDLGEALGIGAREGSFTIYNGVDYEPYQKQLAREVTREVLGIRNDEFVIGFTGRLSKQKGLHILIEAFARFQSVRPGARLLLVGDGPQRAELERLAARLNIRSKIVITGFREGVADMLGAMDLFAMTSLWEGLSRSLVEAMYAKVPVIATDVGGTADALRTGETGWLVRPNDVEAVANALKDAALDRGKGEKMALRAHDWAVRTFDLRDMVRSISQLYTDAFEKSP